MIKLFSKYILFAAVSLLFFACQTKEAVKENSVIDETHVANSVIIIIHGDGDYLFHNKKGEPVLADEAVLKKAIAAAQQMYNSEVFIYHQKTRSNSFLFFPDDDAEYYHFKNGALKRKQTSARSDFSFISESKFYRRYSSGEGRKILLYYGHEIPLNEGYGYNNSFKNKPFNISIFADAIQQFSPSEKMDLVILSTCNNGTPAVIKKLKPAADYIIASPENLHLSYMNPLYLKKLNFINDIEDFTVEFARSAFYDLRNSTETVTAISAYKTSDISDEFLKITSAQQQNTVNNLAENCDCEELPVFNQAESRRGVLVFYKPPSFGKSQFKLEHSGWGCRKQKENTSALNLNQIIQVQQSDQRQNQDRER